MGRTKNVVTPLKVTLEELYTGKVKKMAVNRQVVNKAEGIQTCHACAGRGINADMMQFGFPRTCSVCSGAGKSFKHRREREVLEVHIQRGSPDGHRIRFPEKADELPDADTGDVIFTLKEQEHPVFKRKGADLYIERKISLVEALCGFEMDIQHLDGRKLLIQTAPGDITRPMKNDFDPLATQGDGAAEWECFDGYVCQGIESVARADSADIEVLKEACQKQLKRRGLDIGAFVVDEAGAHFKQCTRSEALAAREPRVGAKLFVVGDPTAAQECRMIKAVVGQGMPTLRNPFVYGNLFLILTIEFPDRLPEEATKSLRKLLPPPLHEPQTDVDDPSIEVHTLTEMDPTASYRENAAQATGEAYDEEEDQGRGADIPMNQCHQM